ncbi:MAG: hypothetical protein QXE75_04860 [Sulfolobales archaeon]
MKKSMLMASMLILALLAASTAVSQAANNVLSMAFIQAEKGNDDVLYLRRHEYNNLTAEGPNETIAASITLNPSPPGLGVAPITKRWVNETAVPRGQYWVIPSGAYNFTFWISRSHDNIIVNVTFKFGYINANGQSVDIVSGTLTNITPRANTITEYYIVVLSQSMVTIDPGSRLFIDITINLSGPPGQSATFYYDGVNQPTRIETPPISQVVPEFPFGAVFLLPALLSAYFILKRYAVKWV